MIKRAIGLLLVSVLTLSMMACGGGAGTKTEAEKKNNEFQVAMIVDSGAVSDGSFAQVIWESIKANTEENGITSKCYKVDAAAGEVYMDAVQKAVDKKAELIIMAGSNFETTVYTAQTTYPDVKFLLIDGVPHDGNNTYATAANTVGIIFAEEEAGFLAGYATVKEGYTKLGFMGGQALPSVKRYGYGFVQGAAAAAAELETKVQINYTYTGTFEPSDDVKALADGWYKGGTEVIFACGGDMGTSVMKAAEGKKGKVIGVDVDQSYLSETVITSAEKGLVNAVEDMLDNYMEDKFVGGVAFNYTARNQGVGLELENSLLQNFSEEDYNKIMKKLKNNKIELKKDTGVNAVTELAGEWVTVVE